MCVSVVCVTDGEECCVMIILNWREMRVSVVCVIDNGEEMLCDDNTKLEKKCAFQLLCLIDDSEEMLCDDNSKLKRNARFSCLCNRRWWRNVAWW